MRTGENIYKRKDGRWEARYSKGRNDAGKIIYGFCYGKTYSEAKEKVQQARKEQSISAISSKYNTYPSFSFYCDEWLNINQLRLKESTYVKYETTLRKYIKPYFGNQLIQELSTATINAFSNDLLGKYGLSPKTVKDTLLILHSILEYIGKRMSGSIPAIDIVYPKEIYKEMRVLSTSEQNRLTNYLLSDMDSCKLGVLLALWTGMRIGELCALRWNHISLSNQYIQVDVTMQRLKDTRPAAKTKTRIIIDTPKSSSSVRMIPINPQAVELCRHMMPQSPAAFVLTGTLKYMEPRVLQYHFQRYMDACGLENVHFHTLRHTFATRCVEVGFEIKSLSEILGHANTAITLNRYVHCSMKLKRENMRKLEAAGM